MNEISNKWIGKNTVRPDGAEKVTGRAQYSSDTTMPGMIWGHVLRSPHPHAKIISINTKKAEALEGVKSVITSKDSRLSIRQTSNTWNSRYALDV